MKSICEKCHGSGMVGEPNFPEKHECEFCDGTGRIGFNVGDRITWQYTHHLNSKSTTEIIKHGKYCGLVRHSQRWHGKQLANVLFDGNKGKSRVPLNSLRKQKTSIDN